MRSQNYRNAILYDISFSFKGWKSTLSPSFITFSEREPVIRGFLWWNSCNYWSQRCIGVRKTCGRSFRSLAMLLTIWQRGQLKLLIQICFIRSKLFQILPLDGSPQHLIHVKLCYFKLGQRFYKVVDRNIYVTSILICLKFNRYPD